MLCAVLHNRPGSIQQLVSGVTQHVASLGVGILHNRE